MSFRVFLKRIYHTVSATVMANILMLVRIKLVAIMTGASGAGILSIVQSYYNIFVGLSSLSAGNVYTRDIAKQNKVNEIDALKKCISMGIKFGFIFAITAVIFWPWSQPDLTEEYIWILIIGFSVFSTALFNQIIFALRGLSELGLIFQLNLICFVLAIIFMLCLHFYGVTSVYWYFFCIPMVQALAIAFNKPTRRLLHNYGFTQSINDIFFYLKDNRILLLLLSSVIVTTSYFVYRFYIIEYFGIETLGYFQLAWMISTLSMIINTSVMSSVFLPEIAKFSEESFIKIFKPFIRQIIFNLVTLGIVVTLFITYGNMLIFLLASDEFLPALQILFVLFFADFLRCIVSPIAYLVFSKGDILGYVGVDIIASAGALLFFVFYQFDDIVFSIGFSQVFALSISLVFIILRLKKLALKKL